MEPPSCAIVDTIWRTFGWRTRARCRLRNRQFDTHITRDCQCRESHWHRPDRVFCRVRAQPEHRSRISFQTADARALPLESNSFDRVFSMLVLQFIPDSARAVAEMRRVVRPGSTVTAAVWDNFGLPHIRLTRDIAAALDPSLDRERPLQPLTAANEMAELWRELGFRDVDQTSLLIRMEYSCFDDYWTPFTTGEGPAGQLIARLSNNIRSALTDHLRNAYLSGRPDGPRSIPCVAWACRGTVPA